MEGLWLNPDSVRFDFGSLGKTHFTVFITPDRFKMSTSSAEE